MRPSRWNWVFVVLLTVLAGAIMLHFVPLHRTNQSAIRSLSQSACDTDDWSPFQGEPTAYSLSFQSRGSARDQMRMDMRLLGTMRLEPLTNREWRLRIAATTMTLSINGIEQTQQVAQSLSMLNQSHVVTLNANNVAVALTTPNDDVFERNLLRDIVATMQVASHPYDCPATWIADEQDTNGIYAARYEHLPGARLRKTPQSARALAGVRVERQGAIDITRNLSQSGATMISARLIQLLKGDAMTLGESASNLLLRRVPFVSMKVLAATPTALPSSKTPMDGRVDAEAAKLRTLQRTAADAPLTPLLAQAEQMDALNGGARAQLIQRLYAHAVTDADSVTTLTQMARTVSSTSSTFNLLVGILAHAGTARAQDALLTLASERAAESPAVKRIILAISQMRAPTTAVEEFVRQTSILPSENGNTATLVLGVIAGAIRASDPARAAAIDASFAALSDGNIALAALGNSASPTLFDCLEHWQELPEAKQRADLMIASRRLERAKVEPFWIDALRNDEDPAVRRAAAVVLGQGDANETTTTTFILCLNDDKDETVRLQLVENLWRVREQDSRIIPALRYAATNDGASSVRKALLRRLTTLPE